MVLAAMFFEAPRPVMPSQLAETLEPTRGNVSHCVSSLEAKGLLQRKIDPEDARAYQLTLKPQAEVRRARDWHPRQSCKRSLSRRWERRRLARCSEPAQAGSALRGETERFTPVERTSQFLCPNMGEFPQIPICEIRLLLYKLRLYSL